MNALHTFPDGKRKRFKSPLGAVVKGVEYISTNFVSQHLSGAGSSPVGSITRDLNSQKLYY